MSKFLSLKQLCELHGVTSRTVRIWVNKGLKFKTGKVNGSIGNLYDEAHVVKWLLEKGLETKVTKAVAAGALSVSKKTPATKATKKAKPDFDIDAIRNELNSALLKEYGIQGALERVRWLEVRIFEAMVSLMLADTDDDEDVSQKSARNSQIASLQALQIKIAPLLKDVEMNFLEYQKKCDILVDAREVRAMWAAVLIGTKEMVMSLGNKTAPFIRPYLKESNDINQVKDIIDKAAAESLMSITESHITKKYKEQD